MLLPILGYVLYLAIATLAQEDGAQFFGYGSGIKGYPVFYSDGMHEAFEAMSEF